MLALLTGLGLASAAGLNAYIPILVVGFLGRYTDLVTVPSQFSWMTSGWALTIFSLLCAAEVILDKVPVVDSANDLIQTFIRPTAGGAVMVASTAAGELDESIGSSTLLADNPWIGWVLGIAVALGVHVTKTTIRPIANTGTLGTAAPVLSTAEDFFSLGMSIIAIIAPVIALFFLVALMFAAIRLIVTARRRKADRAARLRQS